VPPEAVDWALGLRGGRAHLVKDRPWSTVWRLESPAGRCWLKACPPATRHEVRLLDALARWGVPHSLVPVAVDVENGWVLLPDGGPTVREQPVDEAVAAQRWRQVLAGYGEVQRATAPHADELVALGVPDLRPAVLGAAFTELATRWAPDVLTLQARIDDEIAELADLGPAATLQHDDLHDGNVFAAGGRPFDWGDACVGHPFSSLLVALDGGPAPAEYLRNWTLDQPERTVELGIRLGRITRAHSWARALASWPEPPAEFADAPGSWLRTLLED
jgi:hypothetical protein